MFAQVLRVVGCLTSYAIVWAFVGLCQGLAVSGAMAQETPVWSDIQCSQSKLVAPAGLRCRVTQAYSGSNSLISGAGPGGVDKQWAAYGALDDAKIYVFVKEKVSPNGGIVLNLTLQQNIMGLSPYAKDARNFGALGNMNGGDYQNFDSATGEHCIAIRKVGSSRAVGYRWVLLASKCVAPGKSLSDADAGLFMTSTNFRS